MEGEENNVEKRTWDARERGGGKSKVFDQLRNPNTIPVREKGWVQANQKTIIKFDPTELKDEDPPRRLPHKVNHEPLSPKGDIMWSPHIWLSPPEARKSKVNSRGSPTKICTG